MFTRAVQNKLYASNRDKSQALHSIQTIDMSLQNCVPKGFCISTMNIMVRLSIQRVSLDRVRELFDDDGTKLIADECFKTNTLLQKDHEFNNSVIVKYVLGDTAVSENRKKKRTIAIKLFVNGTLQISGCKKVEDALMNGQLMCRFLERIGGVECGTYTVVDFEVHMVNCNFSLGEKNKYINLAKLNVEIQKRCKLFQRYDASNHAGLIISVRSQTSQSAITVMIFANANVIITGFKDWRELVYAYDTVLKLVDDCYNVVTMLK